MTSSNKGKKVLQHKDIRPGRRRSQPDNSPVDQPAEDEIGMHPYLKVISWIKKRFDVRYNELTLEPELMDLKSKKAVILDDRKVDTLWMRLKLEGHNVTPKLMRAILNNDEYFRSYDPIKEYFSKLKWDGKDHIKQLAETVKIEAIKSPDGVYDMQALWNPYLTKWLVSVVSTALQIKPGDQALIFSGEGGLGKSRWAEKLVPIDLLGYRHSGSITPSTTDEQTCNLLAEKFLINLDDQLQTCTYQEYNKLKNIITGPVVSNRKKFHRFTPARNRIASFIGSVDTPAFLTDYKNRRYLIFAVEQINYVHEVNIDQVWAQAHQLLKEGFRYWFSPEESLALNKINQIFRISSPEEELLLKYFRPAAEDDQADILHHLSATDIHTFLSKETNNSRLSPYKIGSAMVGNGFHKISKKIDGTALKKYEVVKLIQPEEKNEEAKK